MRKFTLSRLPALMMMLPVATLSTLASSPVYAETTLTVAVSAPLRSLDPIITTANIVRNYAYMVYDTLLTVDGEGDIKPQMVDHWDISDDGKSYTFTLRNNLKWHDGTPVTAADCMASIERWGAIDKMGQTLLADMQSMEEIDDSTFRMTFNTPGDLVLRALSKPSGMPSFVMPEQVAKMPIDKPITESIGSGPFKFIAEQYRPGVQVVFEKNLDYVPRQEEPDGLAGAHVVNVDKVKWVTMPDPMTAINALKSGEIDMIERAPFDLLSIIKSDSDLKLLTMPEQGGQLILRLNWLQPPFDDKLVRQAALAAVDQESILRAVIGDPEYYRVCGALFGCNSQYAFDNDDARITSADVDVAKALLSEANYDGTPAMIMQASDLATSGGAYTPVIAQEWRETGFQVDVKAMDWQSVVTRRAVRKPVSDGGWNAFSTFVGFPDISTPGNNFIVAANGDRAWFGWPDVPEIEELRRDFLFATNEKERKEIAENIQKLAIDNVLVIPLGEFSMVSAVRKNINNIITNTAPPVYWNITKSDS